MNWPLRIPVHGYAHSTLTAYSEETWTDDAPEIEAVCAAYRAGGHRALLVQAGQAEQVLAGLTSLSNTEDELASDRNEKRRHPEGARMAGAASRGISGISVRLCRAMRG